MSKTYKGLALLRPSPLTDALLLFLAYAALGTLMAVGATL